MRRLSICTDSVSIATLEVLLKQIRSTYSLQTELYLFSSNMSWQLQNAQVQGLGGLHRHSLSNEG